MFSRVTGKAERIAYSNSATTARTIAVTLYGPEATSAVRRVSDGDLISDYSLFKFRVCFCRGKSIRILAYFDSEQLASFFLDYFSSIYPGVKFILDEYGMRTSSMDSESTLF